MPRATPEALIKTCVYLKVKKDNIHLGVRMMKIRLHETDSI